ncbi:hypothetical protein LINGRAHAP2_LOCUS19599 [Linum grandiflorum]
MVRLVNSFVERQFVLKPPRFSKLFSSRSLLQFLLMSSLVVFRSLMLSRIVLISGHGNAWRFLLASLIFYHPLLGSRFVIAEDNLSDMLTLWLGWFEMIVSLLYSWIRCFNLA